jgi:hypothetical protein
VPGRARAIPASTPPSHAHASAAATGAGGGRNSADDGSPAPAEVAYLRFPPPRAAGRFNTDLYLGTSSSVSEALRPLVPSRAAGRFNTDLYLGTSSSVSEALRPLEMPDLGDVSAEREVIMAAHEGSEHAERAERRDLGEATLEQFRADVVRLSHNYMTGEPFPLFQEMRRVRNRMYTALDRRLWPRDQTDVYFLLGCVNCLMAATADDLGYPQAGEELYRAAWAYAVVIDHRPLMGKLRLDLASLAYWQGRPRQARDLAESGLRYLADGPNGAQLHLKLGRAEARLGDAGIARRAIAAAREAREREYTDELLEIGGEFELSRASQQYLAGSILIEIPDAEGEAVTELERATESYAAGPGPGETHGYGMEALAHIELSTARLRSGELDAARAAVQPVLSLPPGKRIDPLPQRLGRVRAELARPRYHGAALAADLDERIEDFTRDTIVAGLRELSAAPG